MSNELADFEAWLRSVCFQKPTTEAYDLAKSAWKEAIAALRSEPVAVDVIKDHIADLKRCVPILVENGMQETADEFSKAAAELSAAISRPSRETAKPEAEPALSAEQVESARRILLSHYGFNNETDLQRRGNINTLCNMALSSLTARDEWKEAVIDELVVSETLTKEHEANPRKAIADVIHWNIQVALDPAVSSDAQKLVNEGIEAAAKAAHESLRDIDRAHAEIAYSAASALKGASHD